MRSSPSNAEVDSRLRFAPLDELAEEAELELELELVLELELDVLDRSEADRARVRVRVLLALLRLAARRLARLLLLSGTTSCSTSPALRKEDMLRVGCSMESARARVAAS